jgi:large subunit ribosomal protein L15
MNLGSLKYADGARSKRKRVGRGDASGKGGTCGRGHKGQMSRSGAKHRAWFEGGQMPIQRRLPKRGFTNIRREENQIVHVGQLDAIVGITEITPEVLKAQGMISHSSRPVKILSDGDLKGSFTFQGVKASKAAKEKIEAAGGTIAEL